MIADLHAIAPGWNSGFRYLLSNANSQRILFYSHGRRFPVTDAWGFGNYYKVALVELKSKKVIFQQNFPANSDVAISPDGRLIVVREQARLTLYPVP